MLVARQMSCPARQHSPAVHRRGGTSAGSVGPSPAGLLRRTSPSRRIATKAMSGDGGFREQLGKMAKQVRDGLPIIGLISRLTTPEGIGGKGGQSYPEFCRYYLVNPQEGFDRSMMELESMGTTQTKTRRFTMICLWICKYGGGIIEDGQLAKAGLRLPITRDIEAEMERFEMDMANIVSKYPLMEPPQTDPAKGAVLAVDAISGCCFGVMQKDGLPDGAAEHISTVVSTVFPEVSKEYIQQAVLMRPSRTY